MERVAEGFTVSFMSGCATLDSTNPLDSLYCISYSPGHVGLRGMGGCVSGTREKARRSRKFLRRLLSSSPHRPALVIATPAGYAGILGNHFLPLRLTLKWALAAWDAYKKAQTVHQETAGCLTQGEEGCQATHLFFRAWETEAAAVGVGDRTFVELGDFRCQPAPGSFLSEGREAVGEDKAFKGTRNTRGYPRMVNTS